MDLNNLSNFACSLHNVYSFQPFYLNIILAIYMYSYVTLVGALTLFFSMFLETQIPSLSFKLILNLVIRYRLRWIFLLIFSAMAALPPSFFFVSKLSLLSSVLSFSPWHISLLFLMYIFFSWAIYYSILRYFLSSVKVTSAFSLSKQRISARNSIVVVCVIL
jgi:hypothetical protein